MTFLKVMLLAILFAIIITVIIAVASGIMNESFESLAVRFLIGYVAAMSASQLHTKEGR
jgi:hypothetical protein